MSFGKKFLRPLRKNLKHLHQPIKWINKRAIKGRTAFYLRYGNQISKIRKQKMKLMDENSSIYIISFSGWRKVEMITFFSPSLFLEEKQTQNCKVLIPNFPIRQILQNSTK